MIRALFFDWFYTLARFDPPREQSYGRVFRECGFELPLDKVHRGILKADQLFFQESAKSPVATRSPEERAEVFTIYPNSIMAEVGEKCSHELALKVVGEILGKYIGRSFALFDDVLPAMKALKQQDFTLGILTNLSRDMVTVCHDLGLDVCLDFIVTSKEAGANKPAPPMFLMALEKSGVKPAEAVHVGDQYSFDVLGARAVGINPVLIDRFDIYPEIRDCPRIRDLSELPQHLG